MCSTSFRRRQYSFIAADFFAGSALLPRHAISSGVDCAFRAIDTACLKSFAFFAAWRKITESQPKLFELVVIKSSAGMMDWDWLEPAGDRAYFAENFGPTEYWMPAADFKRLVPAGVAEHLRPVDEESNTRRLERLQKVAGDTEAVLEYAPNELTFIDIDAVLEAQLRAPTLVEAVDDPKFPVIDTTLPEVPIQFGFDHPNA